MPSSSLLSIILISLPLAYSSHFTTVIVKTVTATASASPAIPADYAAITLASSSPSTTPSAYPSSHGCPCDIDDSTPGTASAFLPGLPFNNGLPPKPFSQPYYPISSGSRYNINWYTPGSSGVASTGTGYAWSSSGCAYPTGTGYAQGGSGYAWGTSGYPRITSGCTSLTGTSYGPGSGYSAPTGIPRPGESGYGGSASGYGDVFGAGPG